MERKITRLLEDWRRSKARLPLIVEGARQVGKTWSILDFGRKNFRNILYFNFESNNDLRNIFDRDLDPHRIIRELSVLAGQSVFEEESLIFFDEIQACGKAITSLKYFAENAPAFPVISAGSLLGVAVNREEFSFPVGKVSVINMFPLDFEEFLWAIGQKKGTELIREAFEDNREFSLHQKFLDHFRQYLTVGGMPRVVEDFVDEGDWIRIAILQKELNMGYISDMAKYASHSETVRIMAVWNSIPAQLLKENKKFQYKVIKSGARASSYADAVDWLKASGIVVACHKVSQGKSPLTTFADPEAFKLYYADTGLLCGLTGISFRQITSESDAISKMRGTLAENYVAVSLKAAGFDSWYWESEGKAEVDFVIQKEGDVIPVEVKAADNVRSKSLLQFVSRYSPPVSYRISTRNFGLENRIRSVPLYAVFCI